MASLPASTLISQAAQAARTSNPLPSPANLPIDHFVFVMMENRSFDHYFGWASGWADGIQHQTFRDHETGKKVKTYHASELGDNMWQGCGFSDPGHGWDEGRAQLKHGFLAEGSGNDKFALAYYNKGELEFIHAAFRKYTLFDRYFCSILGPTYVNRYYKWSAQSGGVKDNSLPVAEQGRQWETLFDRAAKYNPTNLPGQGGPTYRYYNSDLPFSALFGPRALPWTRPLCDYFAACEAGTLENIVIVDPPFTDGGGGQGLSQDEHPHGDVRLGQAWMSDVIHAFMNSVHYRTGALFLIYDEWGGFFDHVRPPRVPDDRAAHDKDDDFGQMGFRIPAVAISPYTLRNGRGVPRVNHDRFGHESIIKFITYKFGLGHLVLRDRHANNIGHAFDFKKTNFDPADLPDPDPPAAVPCQAQEDPEHQQEIQQLADLAEQLGFPVNDCTLDIPSLSGRSRRRNDRSKHDHDKDKSPAAG